MLVPSHKFAVLHPAGQSHARFSLKRGRPACGAHAGHCVSLLHPDRGTAQAGREARASVL